MANELKNPILWKAIIVGIALLVLNLILSGFGFSLLTIGNLSVINYTALVLNAIVIAILVVAFEYFSKNGKIRWNEALLGAAVASLGVTLLGGYIIGASLVTGMGFLIGAIVLAVTLSAGFFLADEYL